MEWPKAIPAESFKTEGVKELMERVTNHTYRAPKPVASKSSDSFTSKLLMDLIGVNGTRWKTVMVNAVNSSGVFLNKFQDQF